MNPENKSKEGISRRDMLLLLGQAAGGMALYQAMGTQSFAADSTYKGPIKLEGNVSGKENKVLIIGAGIAGMVAAYELRKAGYKVSIVEFREKAGGRCWTLRGGDTYTELGGYTQKCNFDKGDYINPGPWRIPFNHYAMLDYCKTLNVKLQPFFHDNSNAYLHSPNAFGGKPKRFGEVFYDMQGHLTNLIADAVKSNKLSAPTDKKLFIEALKSWGGLNPSAKYGTNIYSSMRRGWKVQPGGGLMAEPEFSDPIKFKELIDSKLWSFIESTELYQYQASIFEPVGGMDMIAQAFAKELGSIIRYNTKVNTIKQNEKGVSVTCTDLKSKKDSVIEADWCICTIPLSILSQMDIQVSKEMKSAIDAVPYDTGFKAGIQFKRRFWEEDDRIYGGVTYTDLPLRLMSYPIHNINQKGKGVVLAAYTFGADSYKFSSLDPETRLKEVIDLASQIHPQVKSEFDNGITVAWHRVPWSHGCSGMWTEESRKEHYKNLCEIDGRIMLAGEHASYIAAWQEGSALSAIDAVERLHKVVLNKAPKNK